MDCIFPAEKVIQLKVINKSHRYESAMNATIRNSFFLLALTASLLSPNCPVAQTFTLLHSLTNATYPYGGMVLSTNSLFGTSYFNRGYGGLGTVFKVNTDGTGYAILHSFTNSEGTHPLGGLVQADNTLWGTTSTGGNSGGGTLFKVNTDGIGLQFYIVSLLSIQTRTQTLTALDRQVPSLCLAIFFMEQPNEVALAATARCFE